MVWYGLNLLKLGYKKSLKINFWMHKLFQILTLFPIPAQDILPWKEVVGFDN